MSLETVDIQEVIHKVAEGKLEVIKTVPLQFSPLEQLVKKLEIQSGILDMFSQHDLFKIELELSKPENKELKFRWNEAIRLSTKIRMNLLRCKALDMLETYQNKSETSSAPDIAYCKTLLAGVLTEDVAAARAKYYNPKSSDNNDLSRDDQDEMDHLAGQI